MRLHPTTDLVETTGLVEQKTLTVFSTITVVDCMFLVIPKVRFLTCFASAILSCLCCSTSDSRSRMSWSLSECGPVDDPVTPREADILMALEALELLEEDLSPIPSQVRSLNQLYFSLLFP